MVIQYKLIAVVSENMGLAKNGALPFNLPTEYEFYMRITRETNDKSKKNIMIVGRTSWDCLHEDEKPFPGRITFILTSRNDLDISDKPDTYVFNNWSDIEAKLEDPEFKKKYEEVWVAGGNKLYEYAQKSKYFHSIYISRVRKFAECDTFFPEIVKNVKLVQDDRVPKGVQKENGLEWEVEVWQNTNLDS